MLDTPILLTATIYPQSSEFLKLTDPKIRYVQYIENIVRFITDSPFYKIVFCENSLAEIADKEYLEGICKFYKKEIEFISFEGNSELIKKFHRSFGDQEIIEYALENSRILKKSKSFYKITGRYWVNNIDIIVQSWGNREIVFVGGGIGAKTVHTAFFKTTPSYFYEHFYGKGNQLLQPFANKSLERLYYYYIKQSGIDMTVCGVHPEFSAEWGAGGRMDEKGWRKLKTKIFAYFGVYDIKTTKYQKDSPILKQ